MKNARQLAVITALGLLALATNNAKAILLDVTVSGTATTQSTEIKDGTVTFSEEKSSVNTKDILNIFWSIKRIGNLPNGATLSYDTTATVSNIFTIRGESGVILADCTDLVAFEHNEGAVKTGKQTPATGEVSTTTSFFGTFTFGLPHIIGQPSANIFTLSGLTSAKVSVSKENSNGERKVSEAINLKTGSGPGTIAGRFATITGKVTMESKTITLPTGTPIPTPF